MIFPDVFEYLINNDQSLTIEYLGARQSDVHQYDKYVCGDFEEYIYDPQDRDLAALTYRARFTNSTLRAIRCNLSYQLEKEGRTTRKTGKTVTGEDLDKIKTLGGYAQTQIQPFTDHLITLGGEYYYDKINSENFDVENGNREIVTPTYPDNSKYYSTGIFAQDHWSLRDDLSLELGIRYSYIKTNSPLEYPFDNLVNDFSDVTGAIALSYRPTAYMNLIARWARGFRAPNLNDAVVLKYSSSGVDAPSPWLEPENSNNYELGVKLQIEKADGGLFVYYIQINDLIDRLPGTYNGLSFYDENDNGVQDPDEYDIYQKFNVGEGYIYGFETDVEWRPNNRWTAGGDLSWTYGENKTNNEPLSRIPPLMGRAFVRYAVRQNLRCEMFIRAATEQARLSQRDIDDTRIGPEGTAGWTTLNFRSKLELGTIDINLLLGNISDKAYKEHGSGIYSAGRNISLTVAYGK